MALSVLDLMLLTGPSGLQRAVEKLNLALLAVLAATALFLYVKPRTLWAAAYWPVRNVHVADTWARSSGSRRFP